MNRRKLQLPQGVEPRDFTPEERKWVTALGRLLATCPRTLSLATMGDRNLMVWDQRLVAQAETHDLCDGIWSTNGICMVTLDCACTVHGVPG